MSPAKKNPLFMKMTSQENARTSTHSEVISLLSPPSSTRSSTAGVKQNGNTPHGSSAMSVQKFKQIVSREDAISAVKKILSDETCLFHLASFDVLKGKNLKSPVYGHYDLLCHVNTNTSAGWAVCKYLHSGCCILEKGCQKFDTEHGTTNLMRHHRQHESAKSQAVHTRKIGVKAKQIICRAASMAVVEDLRPFVFAEGSGMRKFVRSVFEAGQAVAIGENIDHDDYIPSSKRVRESVSELCSRERSEFRKNLDSVLKIGGGMSVDGVTMKTQDKHFFDLTVHYFDIQENDPFSMRIPKLMCRTIILAESVGGQSAGEVKSLLSERLQRHYQLKFDDLMNSFTFVTDWAAVMPNIAGASVSENVAPLDEKWMGCIVHQLNTVMKTCLGLCESDPALARVAEDMTAVKNLVRIFKQSKWNHELSDGYHLIQEIETRFATTYEVAKRFLHAGLSAFAVVERHNSEPAKLAKQSILQRKDPGKNVSGFPCIEAIVDACDMIVYTQTRLEASNTPTVHLVLPLLETCKKALLKVEEGAPLNRGFSRGVVAPSEYSVRLCRAMREMLASKVRVHDLWIAGCILHPFLRELQFIDIHQREQLHKRGVEIIRKLLRRTTGVAGCPDTSNLIGVSECLSAEPNQTNVSQRQDISDSGTTHFSSARNRTSSRKFDLLEFADSHFILAPEMEHDELLRYLQTDILKYRLNKDEFMRSDLAALRFWHDNRKEYPALFIVACRVFATPVSSCSSERVFSAIKRVVNTDRTRLTSDILEDIIVLRSSQSPYKKQKSGGRH